MGVEHAGLVAQAGVGRVLDGGADKSANDLLRGVAGDVFAGEQIAQPFLAEEVPVGRPGLGHAVGVQELEDALLSNADRLLTSALAVLEADNVALSRSLVILALEESGKAIGLH